jgi:hypothetical protein
MGYSWDKKKKKKKKKKKEILYTQKYLIHNKTKTKARN